jgi:hypothetical protein
MDRVAWEALSHAYGPAGDLPEILAAAGSSDEQEALDAVERLFSSVYHQGSVYPASAAVVPFVTELVLGPGTHHRALLLALLGGMADPRQADGGPDLAAVRAALDLQAPRLLPLLDDPDPEVRQAAAYAVGQSPGTAGPILARLRERWAVEREPPVRASLLLAGGRLDPGGSRDWLLLALEEPAAPLRAAAALAIVWAGLPWPERATAAVVEAFAAGDPLEDVGGLWDIQDPLCELLEPFDDVAGVPAAVLAALARAPSAEARGAAADAIGWLNQLRRSAPPRLVPLLGPLLADADETVQRAAATTVRAADAAARLVADELAALAARDPFPEGSDRRDAAAEALCTLIGLGDHRWRGPLLAAWRNRRPTYDAARALADAGVAADAELLAAVRERLRSVAGGSRAAHNERAELIWLLGCWGPASAPALPELLAALEHGWGTAARALAAIGPAATPAPPGLRAAAGRGDVAAGAAVWRLAGDAGPLLAAVGQAIQDGPRWPAPIDELLEVGDQARPLLPALGRFLTGTAAFTYPGRHVQVAAARVVWRLTGDPDAVLPTLRAVLAAGEEPAAAAARLAAELGQAARGLVGGLRQALADPRDPGARLAAARALWRLGADPAELVDPLLAAVADPWGGGELAVDLLVELGATTALPRLRELASQDRRVVTSGIADQIIPRDERLVRRLREAVDRLGGHPGPASSD